MKEKLLDVAHVIAKDLHEVGAIDQVTMREFDADCLPRVKDLTANQIRKIRTGQKVSQVVFAKILNTTPSTVRQWEQGQKHPRGVSLKLLNLVAQKGLSVLI
ncbi:MAG: DNA-binding transcriptional regulator [Pseudomonadota bacterium]